MAGRPKNSAKTAAIPKKEIKAPEPVKTTAAVKSDPKDEYLKSLMGDTGSDAAKTPAAIKVDPPAAPEKIKEVLKPKADAPNMIAILAKYDEKCNHPSDINQLLPYLRAVSETCDHITELGVRNPTSTYAFLAGNPKQLVSYDIERTPGISEVEALAPNFKFVLGSTLEVEIEETDFIFFDTHHTQKQLSQELFLHAKKSRKYLGFHDTTSFGERDEAPYEKQPQEVYGTGLGLWAALTPFLQHTPEWKVDFLTAQNNGLLILRRIN